MSSCEVKTCTPRNLTKHQNVDVRFEHLHDGNWSSKARSDRGSQGRQAGSEHARGNPPALLHSSWKFR